MAARRRKFDFTPSLYQEKVFDFVEHGAGNAVISARAGSGKSKTLITAIKLIPKKEKCLFLAFNRSIVEELKEKLKSNKNCHVRTIHSLGYKIVQMKFGSDIEIDEYKYRSYVKSNINKLSRVEAGQMSPRDVNAYIDTICMLIDIARANLAQSVKEIIKTAETYNVPIFYDEAEVALKCMKWGSQNVETIDYTDMVWLPCELQLSAHYMTYDWIMCDEAQDFSRAYIELFMKCFKRGTRFIAVGDRHQQIYHFCGASEEAFDFMENYPNTTKFTLPISYRCDKEIIREANEIVEDIVARDDAGEGMVLQECRIKEIKTGDMVLCRTKAPLMTLYVKLLRRGINAYIKGAEMGDKMMDYIKSFKKYNELNVNLQDDGLFVRMYEDLFKTRNQVMLKYGLDKADASMSTAVLEKYDTINTLAVLAERADNSKDKLLSKIRNVFVQQSDAVVLSTIHKAKGLEADNVYILCRNRMPSSQAHTEWEIQEEENLIYVAVTRAKHKLGYITEKEVKPTGGCLEVEEVMNDLNNIERMVCNILGTEPLKDMESEELTRFRLKMISPVEELQEDNGVKLEEVTEQAVDDDSLLDELLNL